MKVISPQEVFMALAPIVLNAIKPLTTPQRGKGRVLEVGGFKYEHLYRLVRRASRKLEYNFKKTASNQESVPEETERCDEVVVEFLRTLSHNIDKDSLRSLQREAMSPEEVLELDFGIMSKKAKRVRRLYCCKVTFDEIGGSQSSLDKFRNVTLLLDGVIQKEHQTHLLQQLEDMNTALMSFYGVAEEDEDTLSSNSRVNGLSNRQSRAPMTPAQSPRVGDQSTPQPGTIQMWDSKASEVTKIHLKNIFEGLNKRCARCKKPPRKGRKGIPVNTNTRIADAVTANLLLDGTWSEGGNGELQFEVIFEGGENNNTGMRHQPTLVSVIESTEEEVETAEACCLEFHPGLHHQLSATNGRLLRIASKQNNLQSGTGIVWSNAQERPLRYILQAYEIDYREKMRLLLQISRALLDLWGTQWLRPDWGITDIRVYEWQSKNSRHLNIRNPFLSLQLRIANEKGSRARTRIQRKEPASEYHCYPVALSLSVVIMQVLLGEKMFSQAGLISGETGTLYSRLWEDIKENQVQKFYQAIELRKFCKARFGSGWKIMRVVDACLNSSNFVNQENLDQVFRDKIIFPLQNAILDDYDHGEEQEGRSLRKFFESHEHFTTADTILQEIPPQVSPTQAGKKRHFEETNQDRAVTQAVATKPEILIAQEWLSPINDIVEQLRGLSQPPRLQGQEMKNEKCWSRLVKVAVFDAGFDLKSKRLSKRVFLNQPRQPGIVGSYDFVKRTLETTDYASDMHGTEMAGWIMNIMPLAKVYVARVLYGNKWPVKAGDKNEDDYIIEAINHAVHVWQVDIISMSFAINDNRKPSEILQKTIEEVKGKVSIFAAAGNSRHGAKNDVAYPARSRDVIRIYSFKSSGRISDFSPARQPHIPWHMGCIGENLLEPTTKVLTASGSSVATAIAAGIGAIVLDFARFCADVDPTSLDDYVSKHSDMTKQVTVMECLLWEMTGKNMSDYNLIRPKMLFDIGDEDRWIESAVGKIYDIIRKGEEGSL